MCPPTYYDVFYSINPWMDKHSKIHAKRAQAQWEALRQLIIGCGAEVALIDPVDGLPDMVFTANAGLPYKGQVLLSHSKPTERRGESPYFQTWFEAAGLPVVKPGLNSPYFEGGGDAFVVRDRLFAGYGPRTDRRYYEEQPLLQQTRIIYCELATSLFYHLDTCFCPLNERQALWHPTAFTRETQQRLRDEPDLELIEVTPTEAKNLACNAVILDQHVILPAHCPKTEKLLQALGYETHACEMSEFLKAGGACHCLVLSL